jgi:hypothetical protein
MREFLIGEKVRAKKGCPESWYGPVPEYFIVRGLKYNDKGSMSLLVEDPSREKDSFMSRQWHFAGFFSQF